MAISRRAFGIGLLAASAARLRRSAVPSMRARELADRLVRPDLEPGVSPHVRAPNQRHGPEAAKCYDCYTAKEGQ